MIKTQLDMTCSKSRLQISTQIAGKASNQKSVTVLHFVSGLRAVSHYYPDTKLNKIEN